MSGVITDGVESVCNFVVKCFRESGKKKKKNTTQDLYHVSLGLAFVKLLIFVYLQH